MERMLEQSLARNWGLEAGENKSLEEIKAMLEQHLQQLLESDLERLVQTMYRLDVDESSFHAAMRSTDTNNQAASLAELVWQRELKRIEWRLKYERGEL